jgi:hypothetical protein
MTGKNGPPVGVGNSFPLWKEEGEGDPGGSTNCDTIMKLLSLCRDRLSCDTVSKPPVAAIHSRPMLCLHKLEIFFNVFKTDSFEYS